MAHRVVGTGLTVAIAAGTGSTSTPIALQSGYVRIAPTVACHVGLASTSTSLASKSDYLIPTDDYAILKERVASSVVSSASSGSTTTYYFGENVENPFLIGDYVTITNSSSSAYNCTHQLVTGKALNYITLNYSTSTGAATTFSGTANARRSIVVTTLGAASAGYAHVTEVQIASQG
jgi:hypothetical protein